MSKLLSLIYGIIAYVVFFVSFLYAIGFTGNIVVPKSIDSGTETGLVGSLIVNLVLLGLFAVQHTIMARPGFKKWFTRYIPEAVERSTFVLAASLLLLLLFWQWRPLTGTIWHIENSIGSGVIWAVFCVGWLMVLYSTFLINHYDLFGLRQVFYHFGDRPYSHIDFVKTSLYQHVRHPIMVGFIIAFWATPHMTLGHLLFAVGTTGYIILGVHLEEKDLCRALGSDYREYQSEVPMLCPFTKRKNKQQDAATHSSNE